MSRISSCIPWLSLAGLAAVFGCATAPTPSTPSPDEAVTHVQAEALARSRGDFSSVETATFHALKSKVAQADWDQLVELEFAGKYRRDAKTSYATKGNKLLPFEYFESVTEIVKDLEAASNEEIVKSSYRAATGKSLAASDNNEPRLDVERRNARLRGHIRAAKWVANEDQDFHVMVCEGGTGDGQPCFTTEVSGLPKNGVRIAEFRRARRELIAAMRDFVDSTDATKPLKPTSMKDKWAFFDPGILVEISGSLYLDAIHKPGSVGPRPSISSKRDHTTPTAWEIHPIWSIHQLED